jgi:hypothetical protein
MRDALRAFSRWAHGAGRIGVDPTATPNRRARKLGVSPAWEVEIGGWRRWMIGTGTAPTSVRTRTDQPEQFVRARTLAGAVRSVYR